IEIMSRRRPSIPDTIAVRTKSPYGMRFMMVKFLLWINKSGCCSNGSRHQVCAKIRSLLSREIMEKVSETMEYRIMEEMFTMSKCTSHLFLSDQGYRPGCGYRSWFNM